MSAVESRKGPLPLFTSTCSRRERERQIFLHLSQDLLKVH